MPWKSEQQPKWGHTAAGRKALGDAGVKEFDQASKGMKLPAKIENRKRKSGSSYITPGRI